MKVILAIKKVLFQTKRKVPVAHLRDRDPSPNHAEDGNMVHFHGPRETREAHSGK